MEDKRKAARGKGGRRAEILEGILMAGRLGKAAVLADADRVVNGADPCPSCDINGMGLKKTCSDE